MTSEVIRPQEIDVDSEEETDPVWLRQKTVNVRTVSQTPIKALMVYFFVIQTECQEHLLYARVS